MVQIELTYISIKSDVVNSYVQLTTPISGLGSPRPDEVQLLIGWKLVLL